MQTMIFMGLILKIPVAMMLYIVWWAIRSQPAPEEAPEADDGHGFRRYPHPRKPAPPRRGPHAPGASPAPDCPPKRTVRAHSGSAPNPALSGGRRGRLPHE